MSEVISGTRRIPMEGWRAALGVPLPMPFELDGSGRQVGSMDRLMVVWRMTLPTLEKLVAIYVASEGLDVKDGLAWDRLARFVGHSDPAGVQVAVSELVSRGVFA